jgi:ribonuclease R
VVRQAISELESAGEIRRGRHQRFGFLRRPQKIVGRINIAKRGHGYVEVEGAEIDDVFISPKFMKTAFDGDRVVVSLFANSKDRKCEGEVVEILERGRKTVVGNLEESKHFHFVRPDEPHVTRDRDIYIPQELTLGAEHGDKVVVEIERWESEHENPEGKIVEILGEAGNPLTEILSVAKQFNLPTRFPAEVEQKAESIRGVILETEIGRRLDLRNGITFTIDPEDAKDFDDAVSLEMLPTGDYELGVHIADVSYYVKQGSVLDDEALKRGTSVYLMNQVIPMLPEKLSNDICSLRANEDRLTHSVLMRVSKTGVVRDYKIVESVIKSKRRFTYLEVQSVLDSKGRKVGSKKAKKTGKSSQEGTSRSGNNGSAAPDMISGIDENLLKILFQMHDLSQVLMRKRFREGSIDFETPEVKIEFDKEGMPVGIVPKPRLDSHRLIEEFMLLANQTVAKHVGLVRREKDAKPFVYRVHDTPDPEKIRDLANLVARFGHQLYVGGGITQKSLQKLMDEVKGTEEEYIINEIAIRSMAKAVYSDHNIGHFGLGFSHYTHFTSPIRRYPDLVVHRLLKQYSRGVSVARMNEIREMLPEICVQSSEMERRAVEGERESVKIMQVEYMQRHLGDEMEGIISGVTNFGLFVEINDLYVEGLVHIRDMEDDYYIFDEKNFQLVGRGKGRVYRLGDKVYVQVIKVNRERREIDFTLIEKKKRKKPLIHT